MEIRGTQVFEGDVQTGFPLEGDTLKTLTLGWGCGVRLNLRLERRTLRDLLTVFITRLPRL